MKSVIILCLDAFRYDLIDEELTPNLYRATREGVSYSNCQSGNSTTILSMPAAIRTTMISKMIEFAAARG